MEGLIKGLVDVALGHNNDERDDDRPQSREDRSRSSWAEVVSGEQDGDGESDDRRSQPSHGRGHNRCKAEDSSGYRAEEDDADSRPPRPSQKVKQEEYGRHEDSYGQTHGTSKQKAEEANNDDGWETVGKKPQRQPHKIPANNWGGFKRPATEQDYSDEVELGGATDPTEEELRDMSLACNKLWDLDTNRLTPGKDYEVDCGEGKKVYGRDDAAAASLFTWLNEDVLKKPTFSRFCSLLDNYNPNQGSREVVTRDEKEEQAAFVEEISRTAPIKYLHSYLSAKGVVPRDSQGFKRMLTSLWFDLYGRCGTSGSSSAFEHVFVGEVKQQGEQEISGFHNWLQFYLEESKGRVDYQGYIFPRRRGQTPDSETQLLTLQFEWNGILKSVSSTLVGVSPEFEIALYTLCFFVGGEDNRVQLGPYYVNIKCYRHGDRIGSVFPVSES